MGEMEVTRYGNEDTGETFSASDHAFGLTYAMNLPDRFSIGFNGKLIQDAFPYLTDGQRELMISNTCDTCWNKFFPNVEEDDE